jgi:hypothetical protein
VVKEPRYKDEDALRIKVTDRLRTIPACKRPTVHPDMIVSVLYTKRFARLSLDELVTIIIERSEQTARRLAHDTGAENWL